MSLNEAEGHWSGSEAWHRNVAPRFRDRTLRYLLLLSMFKKRGGVPTCQSSNNLLPQAAGVPPRRTLEGKPSCVLVGPAFSIVVGTKITKAVRRETHWVGDRESLSNPRAVRRPMRNHGRLYASPFHGLSTGNAGGRRIL